MRPGEDAEICPSLVSHALHITLTYRHCLTIYFVAGCAHVAQCANSPCNHLKNHNRPWLHLAAFYLAIPFPCVSVQSLHGLEGVQ
jgi:hypothetical protein